MNNSPIPDGPLYTCTFGILSGEPPGVRVLTNGNTFAQDPNAVNLPAGGSDGSVTVVLVVPTVTPTIPPTLTPTAVNTLAGKLSDPYTRMVFSVNCGNAKRMPAKSTSTTANTSSATLR